jgi:hypothetical protein
MYWTPSTQHCMHLTTSQPRPHLAHATHARHAPTRVPCRMQTIMESCIESCMHLTSPLPSAVSADPARRARRQPSQNDLPCCPMLRCHMHGCTPPRPSRLLELGLRCGWKRGLTRGLARQRLRKRIRLAQRARPLLVLGGGEPVVDAVRVEVVRAGQDADLVGLRGRADAQR